MGFNFKLVGFPIFVLLISIIMQTGTVASSSGASVNFRGTSQDVNQNSANQITCNSPTVACFSDSNLPINSRITCQSPNGCLLYNGCTTPVPQGAICRYFLVIFPQDTFFASGVIIDVSGTGSTSSPSITSASFNFGVVGAAGFIIMVIVAVSIAALAGFNLVGSGLNQESIHIIFQGGILLGFWGLLSAAEGFLSGGASSLFVQINGSYNPWGTIFYIILTLMMSFGVISSISRGGTN